MPLRASLVAEPNNDTFVDMLTGLPQVEADFYAKEANCIDWTGKSRVIQSDLEEQYGFVGIFIVKIYPRTCRHGENFPMSRPSVGSLAFQRKMASPSAIF